MKYQVIVGIDISKRTFDVAVRHHEDRSKEQRNFDNTVKGYKALMRWLRMSKIDMKTTLFCLENTGIYHQLLVRYLLHQQAAVWIETPVAIKWSMGLERGKSDRIDARRICEYAARHQEKARLYSGRDSKLQRIADLTSLRERLVDALRRLKTPIDELASVGLRAASQEVERACRKSIMALEKELGALERTIEKIITEDRQFERIYRCARSVKGVGFVATVKLLIYTNGFRRFENAKQLASYAGIAPFPYQSGTSIRGRDRVHPMANKELKTVLHMCAISAIRWNADIKCYYKRKLAEGKNRMLVLNAVRNKLLHRIFACVKNNRLYSVEPIGI